MWSARGISGLSAAHFFRKARPDARILLLDNHDDFGGHAKRNEFTHNGRTYIGYGGTQSIDSPAPYSAVAKALITELGIDVARYSKVLDSALYKSLGLRSASFFDKETFGADRLVVGDVARRGVSRGGRRSATLSRRDLKRLLTEQFDPMPGLTSAEKKARLARMSYADFVTKLWKLDPGVVCAVPNAHARTLRRWCRRGAGAGRLRPRASRLRRRWDSMPGPAPDKTTTRFAMTRPSDYYFHFPDGNASVARLLVRRLVPDAIPGSTVDDVVTARADYSKLDVAASPVQNSSEQLRACACATPDLRAPRRQVEIAYLQNGGTLKTVTTSAAVLACWHTVIPAICPELPAAQKTALDFAIKVPLVYTNVFIRSWTAFQKLGVQRISTPGMWHTSVGLDFPVSLGTYKHQTNPAEPVVLHLSKAACKPGLPVREQHRAGRSELLSTSFRDD